MEDGVYTTPPPELEELTTEQRREVLKSSLVTIEGYARYPSSPSLSLSPPPHLFLILFISTPLPIFNFILQSDKTRVFA
jgi:hypothetical protein